MDESVLHRMRIVVMGGAGNFGARIVRALRGDPNIELLVAGRRIVSVRDAEDVRGVLIDIDEADFAQALKALSPGLGCPSSTPDTIAGGVISGGQRLLACSLSSI